MMKFDWWQCFGTCLSRRPRQLTLLLVGVNNAGKTTLLNSLKGDMLSETVPTYGFNTADIMAPACTIKLYDLGGGRSIRRIWSIYAPEVHGVIYVVDSADPASFPEARSALQQLLAAPQLAGKPLLLFANKQDLPGAQALEAVAAAMSLPELQAQQNNPCTAVACTARGTAQQQHADPALCQGLQWLQATIGPLYGQLQAKVVREAAAAKAEEEQRRQVRQERAQHNKLAREKQELQQHHQQVQQIEQQQTTRLQVQQQEKQLHEISNTQGGQQLQMPEQLIPASWPGSEPASRRASQQLSSTQPTCSESTPMDHSASAALPAVPGDCAATDVGDCNTAAAAAADAVSLAAASSCTSASPASTGVPELPSIPDQQCSQLAAPALPSPSAAAGASQPPATSGVSVSLLHLLQAAVSLPGSATAAPPAAPEFCDLRQVAHDLCGPTPRSHSISSGSSSLLLSEASQLRPKALPTTSSMQHHGRAAGAAAAGSRRVSGAGALAGGANARRGSSSTAPSKAAIQLPRMVARSRSLPVSDAGLYGSGSPPVGIAEHGTAPRCTTSSRTSVSNRVQPIA